jgi:hypothetical protein
MDYPNHKRYPTFTDISEMKARGYDRETLERAEADYQRGLDALELCAEIRAAFLEVKLGNGVGLLEGQGLDDYEHPDTCAQYKEEGRER